MVLGLIVLVALGWASATFILPFVIFMLESVITATALGVIAFALLWAVLDKRNWTLAQASYQNAMRWLTSWIIELDPIGIMRNYVDDLKEKLKEMNDRVSLLRGEMRSTEETIKSNASAAEKALTMAKAAQGAHKQGQFILQSRQNNRLTTSNRTLQQLYDKMKFIHDYLLRMRENTEILIADMEAEIDTKSRERKSVRAAYSAVSASMSVIHGDKNKRALFEEALEIQAADYGQKMGQIEEFMDVAGTFLDSLDLENGIYEEEAMKQLEQWEQRSTQLLIENKSSHLITPEPPVREDVYAKLLKP